MSFQSYHPEGHGCSIYNPKRDKEIEEKTSTNLPETLISGHWANDGNSLKKREIDSFSYTVYFPNKVNIPKILKETKFEDLEFKFADDLNQGIFYDKHLNYKNLFSGGIQTKNLIGSVSQEKGGWAITLLNTDKKIINKFNAYIGGVYKNILTKYEHTKNMDYDFLKKIK